MRRSVAIVGGGPGGLFTALLLGREMATPPRITLFEASNRLGGKIVTGRFHSGGHYEAGAAELYDYSSIDIDPLRDLVEEFGLPIIEMGGAAAVLDGRVIGNLEQLQDRLGAGAAAAFVAFDARAKASITPLDFYESGSVPGRVEPGSFADHLEGIGDAAVRRYIEILVHSDLATEPARTSVQYGLHNYLMNDPRYLRLYCIGGGNEQLVDALAARIDADIRLGTPVVEVGATSDGAIGLTSEGPRGRREEPFDIVILALPHECLARLRFVGEKLESALACHLKRHDHPAHYLRVTILFDRPFWRGLVSDSFFMLDHFGGCCLYDESARAPDEGAAALGWLLSGAEAERLASLDDDDLVSLMLGALPEPLASARGRVVESRVHRWINAVSALPGGWPPTGLDERHRPEPVGHPGLFLVGDYLFDSTLNGVLDSAQHVAGWVAAIDTETMPARTTP